MQHDRILVPLPDRWGPGNLYQLIPPPLSPVSSALQDGLER